MKPIAICAWLAIAAAACITIVFVGAMKPASTGAFLLFSAWLVIADASFWHPDAQGALAVLMVPLLQGVALALLLPLAGWASRRTPLP